MADSPDLLPDDRKLGSDRQGRVLIDRLRKPAFRHLPHDEGVGQPDRARWVYNSSF